MLASHHVVDGLVESAPIIRKCDKETPVQPAPAEPGLLSAPAQLCREYTSHRFVRLMSVENMNLLSIHLVLSPLLDEGTEKKGHANSLGA